MLETVLGAVHREIGNISNGAFECDYHHYHYIASLNKLRTAQRAMERKMLDLKLQDKIPCSEIRKRTKIIDIIEYTLKQK